MDEFQCNQLIVESIISSNSLSFFILIVHETKHTKSILNHNNFVEVDQQLQKSTKTCFERNLYGRSLNMSTLLCFHKLKLVQFQNTMQHHHT